MSPKLHYHLQHASRQAVRDIADWFHQLSVEHGKFDAVLVDLAEINLPIFDEPEHPVLQHYRHDHTKRWAASVNSADAYVFVTGI